MFALALEPAPHASWCVVQRDGSRDQPACYENLITCIMAALARDELFRQFQQWKERSPHE